MSDIAAHSDQLDPLKNTLASLISCWRFFKACNKNAFFFRVKAFFFVLFVFLVCTTEEHQNLKHFKKSFSLQLNYSVKQLKKVFQSISNFKVRFCKCIKSITHHNIIKTKRAQMSNNMRIFITVKYAFI